MLPDYQKVKGKISKKFNRIVTEKVRGNPLLAQFPVFYVHEGETFKVKTSDGYEDNTSFKVIQSAFNIKNEELIEKGPIAIISQADQVSKELIDKESKTWFSKMDEVTEKTGNVIDGHGKALSPDLILNALEKVQFDFDESGKPKMPTLFISPDVYERIREDIPKWEADVNYRNKYLKIIEKKWREWIARESNRKLVD